MTNVKVHLSKLTQAVQRAYPLLEGQDIAEAVWLAQFMDFVSEEPKFEIPKAEQKNEPETPKPLENPLPEQSSEPDKPESPTATDVTSEPDNIPLYAESSKAEGTSQGGQPIRVPGVRMLQDRLLLERALRPLRRQVLSRQYFELDEVATIDASAEQNIITPVLKGKAERWLDAHIVIDCGLSMIVWRETLHELTLLFKNSGIYANVQIWYLFTDEKEAYLTASNQTEARHCNPAELLNPRKQQLVLMCTDCASSAWFSGSVTKGFLSCWQEKMPVAMIQMLPQRLWLGTALRNSELVNFTSSNPAALNKCLVNDDSWFDEGEQAELMQLPVITIDPISLDALAKVLTGNKSQWVSGVLVEQETFPIELTKELEQVSAEQRLQRFRQQVSPLARKLAEYFSCIPLTLPVMRMVQHMMLPESNQTHLAEFLLGGLVKTVKFGTAEYEFYDGLKTALRDKLVISDRKKIQTKVEDFINENHDNLIDFWGLINNGVEDGNNVLGKEFSRIKTKENIFDNAVNNKDKENTGFEIRLADEVRGVSAFIVSLSACFLEKNPHLLTQVKNFFQIPYKALNADGNAIQAIGAALWDALQADDLLHKAKQTVDQPDLPIIIESTDAAVLSLPWETLYHPFYGFLGREFGFTLSRHKPSTQVKLPEVTAEPLRVLVFTSLPDDGARLEVEAEQASIQEALMEPERNGKVVLEMPDDGRLETFQSVLQAFQPHVVYLSGHGNFTHDPARRQAYGGFLFEDEHGRGVYVTEMKLAACFQNTRVQLVIISSSDSAKQHPEYPANGLSNALYRVGIPHVIGMGGGIPDRTATQFAASLLRALGREKPVDVALQDARTAIGSEHGVYGLQDSSSILQQQWYIPQLLSHDLRQPLVNWSFTPKLQQFTRSQTRFGEISLPERFIGRRRELRQWQNRLRSKAVNSLLITGAGGIGKTALAGKLLKMLADDGYALFTFSLRSEHDWQSVLLDMELVLAEDQTLYHKYQLIQNTGLSETKKNEYLLKFLLERCSGKLVLFFDNLDSVQQKQAPHALTDLTLQHWLDAVKALTRQGMKLVVTSRWRLPDWPDNEHCHLGKPVYADFVEMVRLHQLPLQGGRLERVYQTLGGNFRALTFFANAAKGMNLKEEQSFLNALGQAETSGQTDMAIAKVVGQCDPSEQALLQRLLAYQVAVPLDGVQVAWESPLISSPTFSGIEGGQSEKMKQILQHLLNVSLVEQYEIQGEQTTYQVAVLVRSWLLANGAPEPDQPLLQKAANFLLWQLEEGQNTTWEHKLATHAALLTANLKEQGQQLVLKWIIEPLNRVGMYRTLLDDWLPPLAEADNLQIRGEALEQTGKQYYHLGQYETALDFLRKSLAIRQEIGDELGEGTTLSNLSQIYHARGDYNTALEYLQQSLAIQQEIGDKQGMGATLNNISQIFQARGDYNIALEYLQQSLAIQQEIGGKQGMGATLNNISQIFQARGDYNTALEYLQQSLAIRQEIGDKSGIGATLNNISQIYDARGDYNTALEYLQQSLAIRQEIGEKFGEAATLSNLSQIYSARGDYDTALDFLKQSLAITQEIGDKSGEGATLNNLSQIYIARGDYNKALALLQQSLAIQQEIGDVASLCSILFNIGHVHLQNEEVTEAVQAWVTVYGIAKKINLANALQALEKLAENIGLPNGLQGWEMLSSQLESNVNSNSENINSDTLSIYR